MTLDVRRLTRPEFAAGLPEFRDIFAAALGLGAFEAQVLAFGEHAPEHSREPSFSAVAAFVDGRPAGFAYGYDATPGQWWYEQVARQLETEHRRRWLADAFELVEIHVRPEAQGQGLGGRLHDLLLSGVRRATAVLSTPATESRAMLLYRGRGWTTLAEGRLFEGVRDRYRVMGLELLTRRAAP